VAGDGSGTLTGGRWMGVGRSTLPNSRSAGLEATAAALDGRDDAQVVIVFCSNRHDLPALMSGINEASGGVPLVGCSTAGEFSQTGPTDGGVVVTALGGSGFSVSTSMARRAGERPRAAGAEIAHCVDDVAARPHKVLMLLVDGVAQEQEEILRGIYSVVGASVPLVGGCAGEETFEGRPTQLYGNEVLHDCVVGVAIGSDAPLGIGIKHGWRKVGDAMVVTSSRKGWINTLDDRPALDTYLDRIGAPPKAYETYDALAPYVADRPLGIRRRSGDEVRGITPHTDFTTRALHCGGEITQGSLIWCMEGDVDGLLDATDEACAEALAAIGDNPPLGMLAFDCWGRRNLLGADGVRDEVARVTAKVGGAPVAGFYTYGEIARTRGINGYHHQTLVVLAVA